MKWENRPYDVFVVENYLDLSNRKSNIKENQTPEMQGVSKRLIKLLKESNLTIQEGLTNVLDELKINRTPEMEEALLNHIKHEVLWYIRTEATTKIVKSLLERGCCVAVQGANWSTFSKKYLQEKKEKLVIIDGAEPIKRVLKKSKCYLEIEPEKTIELSDNIKSAIEEGCYILAGGGAERDNSCDDIKGVFFEGQKYNEMYKFIRNYVKK